MTNHLQHPHNSQQQPSLASYPNNHKQERQQQFFSAWLASQTIDSFQAFENPTPNAVAAGTAKASVYSASDTRVLSYHDSLPTPLLHNRNRHATHAPQRRAWKTDCIQLARQRGCPRTLTLPPTPTPTPTPLRPHPAKNDIAKAVKPATAQLPAHLHLPASPPSVRPSAQPSRSRPTLLVSPQTLRPVTTERYSLFPLPPSSLRKGTFILARSPSAPTRLANPPSPTWRALGRRRRAAWIRRRLPGGDPWRDGTEVGACASDSSIGDGERSGAVAVAVPVPHAGRGRRSSLRRGQDRTEVMGVRDGAQRGAVSGCRLQS